MKSYKDPSFQERVGRAAEAKQKALNNLRSKPPVDERIVAERQATRLKREIAEAAKRAARKAAEQAAREAKAADAAAKAAPVPVPPTEAEKKLARDARYAARKTRK
jgi:septal ring factor EnvC (AmiA/AmiB activator)